MRVLRHIGADAECFAHRRFRGAADSDAADFLRCGDVTIQQRRRQVGDRDVIEAVA